MSESRIPVSTYRLQFNQQLRFNDAKALVPYLSRLGITDLYASPLLQARRGSAHGYDVTDPTHLNSELGTDEEFDALVHELQAHGMGLLLDIVPNHMAASSENPWWMDLLEDGPRSAFASHFDVDWHPPSRSLDSRVLLPILGKPYAEALEQRELRLTYNRAGFGIRYFDNTLPIAVHSYNRLLGYRQDRLERTLGSNSPLWLEFQGVQAAVAQIPPPGTAAQEAPAERRQHRETIRERLWQAYTASPEIKRFIDGNVRLFNGRRGIPATFLLLDQLLSDQAYVLAFWRTANQEINYRRFFTISDLVGIRVEDPMTFEAIHSVALRLATKGMVTGLRVDHIDGLRDPLGYLRRLQDHVNPEARGRTRDFYVVVEKILSQGEPLPADWPVQGTTGYEFLNAVNNLFVDTSNLPALRQAYARFTGNYLEYADLVYEKKKQVMATMLSVEMRTLGRYLGLLAAHDRYARELPRADLGRALVEATACLEPYRTYVRGFEVRTQDRLAIEKALSRAQQRNTSIDPACFRFLSEVLLLQPSPHLLPEQRESRLSFVMTWQQFTGPITAKGVEDSALYIYNPLISVNEVGGSPAKPGLRLCDFDEFLQLRRRKWPFAMNTSMTHDAKRGEDVRARIDVLSEFPQEWEHHLNNWSQWNHSKGSVVNGIRVPERNEEILLYQTLLGSWPASGPACQCYVRRIQEFIVKAEREAMVHTRWTIPNLEHERALMSFVQAILEDVPGNRFLPDFCKFATRIAYHGALNSLSQLLVKLASPGVADFYQGTETWDLRLVDPDNRGAVDFPQREQMLDALGSRDDSMTTLISSWHDSRIKMLITTRGLQFRKKHSALFLKGAYIPLRVLGPHKNSVIAFARRYRGDWCIAVAQRFTTRLGKSMDPGAAPAWRGTAISLPEDAPIRWANVFDEHSISVPVGDNRVLPLESVLKVFPVALLSGD
jgi:(1->4)-alpha-D-glucan 1-alpha-D-glucosylmutase